MKSSVPVRAFKLADRLNSSNLFACSTDFPALILGKLKKMTFDLYKIWVIDLEQGAVLESCQWCENTDSKWHHYNSVLSSLLAIY